MKKIKKNYFEKLNIHADMNDALLRSVKFYFKRWSIVILFLGCPTLAYADAGLPMLAVVWPLSLPAFIPVVLIESWVIQRDLKVGWRLALEQVTKANLLSTIAGIPLTWLALTAIEFLFAFLTRESGLSNSYPPMVLGDAARVFLTAPWLGPFTKGAEWIVPLATTVLLVPFFFVSYWIESWYVSEKLSPVNLKRGQRALWKANLLSYAILIVCSLFWLVWGVATHASI